MGDRMRKIQALVLSAVLLAGNGFAQEIMWLSVDSLKNLKNSLTEKFVANQERKKAAAEEEVKLLICYNLSRINIELAAGFCTQDQIDQLKAERLARQNKNQEDLRNKESKINKVESNGVWELIGLGVVVTIGYFVYKNLEEKKEQQARENDLRFANTYVEASTELKMFFDGPKNFEDVFKEKAPDFEGVIDNFQNLYNNNLIDSVDKLLLAESATALANYGLFLKNGRRDSDLLGKSLMGLKFANAFDKSSVVLDYASSIILCDPLFSNDNHLAKQLVYRNFLKNANLQLELMMVWGSNDISIRQSIGGYKDQYRHFLKCSKKSLEESRFAHVKATENLDELRYFLEDYSDSNYTPEIKARYDKLEQKAWSDINQKPLNKITKGEIDQFLIDFSIGVHKKEALILRDEVYWIASNSVGSLEAYTSYLKDFPAGRYKSQALEKIEDIEFNTAIVENSEEGYRRYLEKYPNSKYKSIAEAKMDDAAWRKAQSVDTEAVYSDYLLRFTVGRNSNLAKNRLSQLIEARLFSESMKAKEGFAVAASIDVKPSDAASVKFSVSNVQIIDNIELTIPEFGVAISNGSPQIYIGLSLDYWLVRQFAIGAFVNSFGGFVQSPTEKNTYEFSANNFVFGGQVKYASSNVFTIDLKGGYRSCSNSSCGSWMLGGAMKYYF